MPSLRIKSEAELAFYLFRFESSLEMVGAMIANRELDWDFLSTSRAASESSSNSFSSMCWSVRTFAVSWFEIFFSFHIFFSSPNQKC